MANGRFASALAPGLVVVILAGPVCAGLLATLMPAFGYFPALGGHHLSLAHVGAVLAMPGIGASIAASMFAGLATTLASLGIVMLFVAAFAGTPTLARLQTLLSPLLAVPHAAVALGLALLVAPSGLLLRLISPHLTGFETPPDWLIVNDPAGLSMLAALIIKEIPFLFLMALASLPQVPLHPARLLMQGLGYGRIAGFLLVLGPPLYRQMRLATFGVLAYCASTVDVAIILGPTLPPVLAVRVAQWMGDSDLQMRFVASAGALVQLLVVLACMLLWLGVERSASALVRLLRESGWRATRDRWARMVVLCAVSVSTATVIACLATLAAWSVAGLWPFPDALPSDAGMATWMRTLPRILAPLVTTLVIATASAGLALVVTIALLWTYSRRERSLPPSLRNLLFLPLILPQLSFVFGLQLLAILLGAGPGLASLVLVHLVFVLPYTVLSLSAPWSAFDRRLERIAHGLGKGPWTVLMTIRLPLLLRPCLTALAVGIAVSVGLYLPTLLIGAGRLTTITTEAVALSAGGDRRVIGVYAFLQALLPFGGFLIASAVPQLLFRQRRAMRI